MFLSKTQTLLQDCYPLQQTRSTLSCFYSPCLHSYLVALIYSTLPSILVKGNEITGTDKLTIADINLLTLKGIATKVIYIVSCTKKVKRTLRNVIWIDIIS